ncbi:hypothetical protein PsorP6_001016 [Peronosclerospora sorghi]|uniref:Uncharacterized protein n=1 Tax=Peronosclerospora sorghi TaxID=230839 RepID=A0ACC0WTN7_9STRA|nr:hypothetical protein PsorP6_001016 [Peronosclerospora sorghi]
MEANLSADDNVEELISTQKQEQVSRFIQTGITLSGRTVTKRVETGALKPKAHVKKKKNVVLVESKLPEEDLCGVCGEIEDDLTTLFCAMVVA